LILISFVIIVTLTRSHHNCGHESKKIQNHYNKMQENYEKIQNSNFDQRILQTEGDAMPIRITIDYSMLDQIKSGITRQQKEYLKEIMETSKLFFQRLLKVQPIKKITFIRQIGHMIVQILIFLKKIIQLELLIRIYTYTQFMKMKIIIILQMLFCVLFLMKESKDRHLEELVLILKN
ncbi:hypothetical protein IMG5_036820, partial [Ichthyophthirius multifiliis]